MNPFQAINDIYEKSVKKEDKRGYAKLYKEATETIFKSINDNMDEGREITFKDVQYLDGYYIFGTGTNSVVHFHIEECPGWKFGIWWNPPIKKDSYTLTASAFAQYEETIDKFKPSASAINITITSNRFASGGLIFGGVYSLAETINFIRDEPYLAFCRHYNGWNYNYHYHTREEAKEEFEKYKAWHDAKVKYGQENNEKVLSFVREKIIPHFSGSYLVDCGPNCSPRYDLIAPYRLNKEIVDEPGLYGWFDPDVKEEMDLKEEWDALIKEGNDISDKYEFFWSIPIHDVIHFYGVTAEQDLEDLDLSKTLNNILARAGLKTVGDIVERYKNNELESIRGIGQKRYKEIVDRLLELSAIMDLTK